MKEIAEKGGVTPSTVSRALNPSSSAKISDSVFLQKHSYSLLMPHADDMLDKDNKQLCEFLKLSKPVNWRGFPAEKHNPSLPNPR